MLYPFMTLNDNTEIVHSETIETNGHEQVKVVIEKPVVGGFHSATCWLPEYRWENIDGFSEEEIKYFQDYLASVAHLIIEFSKESNILNASSSAKALLKIQDVKVTGDKMLLLTFSSGEKRVFDATVLKGEVFAPLNNPAVFNNFKIVHGVITWMNEEIDCAPEYMYENSYKYLDMEAVI